MSMQSVPPAPPQSSMRAMTLRLWWLFPLWWAVVYCIGLALATLALYASHPERLEGWSGIGLGVILPGILVLYVLLTWGWLYRKPPISVRLGLLIFGVQIVLLLFLLGWYSSSFAWISLVLVYLVIGGLPRRQWALPLAAALLVFVIGSLPLEGTGGVDTRSLLGTLLQIAAAVGIAALIRVLFGQRDQLQAALRELREANAELAASAAQKEELAVLRERTRLARAMHDNIGHALVLMNVKLEAAQLLYAREPARGDAELEATRTLIRSTMAELRLALSDLRSPVTGHDDLGAALRQLANEMQARTGIAVTCSLSPDTLQALPELAAEPREALWHVAREALSNVERHAAASHTTVTLDRPDDGWRLRVADDGSGIQPADLGRPEHYGVVGMRERMKEIGGTLSIQRGASGGTVLEAFVPAPMSVPVPAAEASA